MGYSDDGVLPEITVDEAIARVAGGATLIDVREQDEWDAGHAPTAQLLPLSEIQERLGELPADTQLLIVCHSGGRSARVTELLLTQGFDAVNVAGGMTAWRAAGADIDGQGPAA